MLCLYCDTSSTVDPKILLPTDLKHLKIAIFLVCFTFGLPWQLLVIYGYIIDHRGYVVTVHVLIVCVYLYAECSQ